VSPCSSKEQQQGGLWTGGRAGCKVCSSSDSCCCEGDCGAGCAMQPGLLCWVAASRECMDDGGDYRRCCSGEVVAAAGKSVNGVGTHGVCPARDCRHLQAVRGGVMHVGWLVGKHGGCYVITFPHCVEPWHSRCLMQAACLKGGGGACRSRETCVTFKQGI
jgi:hypothetical protein